MRLGVLLVLAGCATPVVAPEPAALPAAPVAIAPPAPELERAPAFAFAALADSSQSYGLDDYAGRFVLIDFWASWCAPCLDEIPRIAAVHADYADRLDVLSVSFDLFPDDVTAFRERVHPMPWDHAFVAERFDDASALAFGVDRLPDAVLIGPDGTVRARSGYLRRDLLRITIERELGITP